MTDESPKTASLLVSVLSQYPEHVNAIGMVSIEIANLERELAGLLSAVLFIYIKVAHAIFFAPNSAGVRLDILQEAAKAILTDPINSQESELGKQKMDAWRKVEKILNRSRKVIQRRHEIMHNSWAVSENEILRSEKNPGIWPQQNFIPVPIQSLNDLVRDIRTLVMDVNHLAHAFHNHPPIMADMATIEKAKT